MAAGSCYIRIKSGIFHDFAAAIVYTIASGSTAFFSLNRDTGSLRLLKDLREASETAFDFVVTASDGVWQDEMELHLDVVVENLYAPSFLQDQYEVEVSEMEAAGSRLRLELEATDQDSTQLTYSIQSGNEGNLFKIDTFTGE